MSINDIIIGGGCPRCGARDFQEHAEDCYLNPKNQLNNIYNKLHSYDYWKSEYNKYEKQIKEIRKYQNEALSNMQIYCKHKNIKPIEDDLIGENPYKKCMECGKTSLVNIAYVNICYDCSDKISKCQCCEKNISK